MGDGKCENYVAKVSEMRHEATAFEIFVNEWHCGTGKGVPSCVNSKKLLRRKAEQLRADADALEKLCKGKK